MLKGVIPDGWQPTRSSAIESFRYDAAAGVLQLLFIEGRLVYDYPCDERMFARFVSASSKGGFVNEVLKPNAKALGWSRPPRKWAGG